MKPIEMRIETFQYNSKSKIDFENSPTSSDWTTFTLYIPIGKIVANWFVTVILWILDIPKNGQGWHMSGAIFVVIAAIILRNGLIFAFPDINLQTSVTGVLKIWWILPSETWKKSNFDWKWTLFNLK
jgi:hypothetical protein